MLRKFIEKHGVILSTVLMAGLCTGTSMFVTLATMLILDVPRLWFGLTLGSVVPFAISGPVSYLYIKLVKTLDESERELSATQKRLNLAMDAANLAVWEHNLQTQQAVRDPRWARLLGYEPEEIEPTVNGWAELVHPDDYPQAQKALEAHLAGESPIYEHEHRVLHKSGIWQWHLSRAKVFDYDISGRPIWLTGVTFDITDRKLTEERIKAGAREKEILLREIHHRVKNNLQVMGSMLALQCAYKKDVSVAEVLKDAEQRIWSMALVHETLYGSGDVGRTVGPEYFERLLNHFHMSHGGSAWNIRLEKEIEDVSLGLDAAMNCGLIINELISNCVKHAFPEETEGTIKVCLRSVGGEQVELVVSDNGVGMREEGDVESIRSFGLDLVGMLVDGLDGKIENRAKDGTEVRITFKHVDGRNRVVNDGHPKDTNR